MCVWGGGVRSPSPTCMCARVRWLHPAPTRARADTHVGVWLRLCGRQLTIGISVGLATKLADLGTMTLAGLAGAQESP